MKKIFDKSKDYDATIDEIVARTKKFCFGDLKRSDQRDIAIHYLEHSNNVTRKDAQDYLAECAAECAQDWVGHLIKGEFQEVSETILDRFCLYLLNCGLVEEDIERSCCRIFGEAIDEDPAPRKGGRLEDVL